MLRRVLSLVLLAVFSLPLLAQAAAWTQRDSEAGLPACCRRHGAHHCSMGMAEKSGAPSVSARCRMWPVRTVTPPAGAAFTPVLATPRLHLPMTMDDVRALADARRRMALERARYKRGPPQIVL